jgi:acetoin utilization deacetylase AcuC-like enzyme
MILSRPTSRYSLSDFGIQIPFYDNRIEQILSSLKPEIKSQVWQSNKQFITREDLLRVHSLRYVERALAANPQDFVFEAFELVDAQGNYNRFNPDNQKYAFNQLINHHLSSLNGTIEIGYYALENGFGFFLGGGGHHAYPDYPSGFCLFNDVAIAIRKFQSMKKIKTAWVIDLDAHKGDGTAYIFHQDPEVKTLSIHMKDGWPLDSQDTKNLCFTPSFIDLNIGKGEEKKYLTQLELGLKTLDQTFIPDIVFVVDGADPYEFDELPSTSLLKLTKEEMFSRDRMVYEFLLERKIPQAWVMAGGYGHRVYEIYSQFLNSLI